MCIQPIKTEKQYEEALLMLELLSDAKPGAEQYENYELLTIYISMYEKEKIPVHLPELNEVFNFNLGNLDMGNSQYAY